MKASVWLNPQDFPDTGLAAELMIHASLMGTVADTIAVLSAFERAYAAFFQYHLTLAAAREGKIHQLLFVDWHDIAASPQYQPLVVSNVSYHSPPTFSFAGNHGVIGDIAYVLAGGPRAEIERIRAETEYYRAKARKEKEEANYLIEKRYNVALNSNFVKWQLGQYIEESSDEKMQALEAQGFTNASAGSLVAKLYTRPAENLVSKIDRWL